MSHTPRMLRLVVFGIALASSFAATARDPSAVAHARESDTYDARGVVKSFGPDRKYVVIAHEKIAGYMEAMTMSFEPRTPEQLQGIEGGDRVTFTFVATKDGRRVLQSIQRVAPPAR